MDVRQALLDARVAEAAEAWLADPRDVAVYSRLVAAVDQRRRHLDGSALSGSDLSGSDLSGSDLSGSDLSGDLEHSSDAVLEPPGVADLERSDDARFEGAEEPLHGPFPQGSRRAVRAVGADLTGDPAAVLRRLRGG